MSENENDSRDEEKGNTIAIIIAIVSIIFVFIFWNSIISLIGWIFSIPIKIISLITDLIVLIWDTIIATVRLFCVPVLIYYINKGIKIRKTDTEKALLIFITCTIAIVIGHLIGLFEYYYIAIEFIFKKIRNIIINSDGLLRNVIKNIR